MSVIHEALKRAERERAAGLGARKFDPPAPAATPASAPGRRRRWVLMALGLPVLALAGVFLTSLRPPSETGAPTSRPLTHPSPPAPKAVGHPVASAAPAAPTATPQPPAAAPATAAAAPDPGELNLRAVAAFRAGRPEEARLLLEQLLRTAPALPEAHNNLGMVLHGLGRRAEAREALQRALELSPGYPEALNNLGLLSSATGNTNDAVRFFEQALAARSDYGSAHLNLAIVYDKMSRRAEALKHYRKFLENPGADGKDLVGRVRERLRR